MRSLNPLRTVRLWAGIALIAGLALLESTGAPSFALERAASETPLSGPVIAPAEQLGRTFAAVAAHIRPAVVSVYSDKVVRLQAPDSPFGDEFFRRFFGEQFPPGSGDQPREYHQSGMGSGMILDKQGHILTNFHVVSDVDQIKVKLADQRSFDATIVGVDPKTDVAVIRMTGALPADLPTVQIGDSDALEVGHLVMAVGAPFGLTQTVTTGIVSAKGRADVGIAAYEDFIQTDAPINPGNSGGPLVNMRGEVIGMNSAIATGGGGQSAGVGFAIPSNMIKSMLPVLIRGGQITRGMLGVGIQDLNAELAELFRVPDGKGALVSQVAKGSPADKAGLRPGDVIVRYDGKEIANAHRLRNLVAATAPGTRVDVAVVRNGRESTYHVTVGKLPAEPAGELSRPSGGGGDRLAALGLRAQTLTRDLANQLDLQGVKGVLVTGVAQGSPAAEAGLQPGDLIVEAGRKPVATVADLQAALDRAKDRILLLVRRQGATLFVVMRLK